MTIERFSKATLLSHINQRILVADTKTSTNGNVYEIKLLEIDPTEQCIKIQYTLSNVTQWVNLQTFMESYAYISTLT
jgi:hypothetical protein